MQPILLALMALAMSAFMTRQFCRPTSWFHILDVPNDRSLHAHPTPRTGGVAIVFAFLTTGTIFVWRDVGPFPAIAIGVAVATIALTSYVDDRYGLSVRIRFFVHSVTATLFVATLFFDLLHVDAQLIGLALAVLFLVWMINLYNFMDGMDGFAGGMGVFGFGAFAVVGWTQSHETFFVLNLLISAACAGFLVFNFPPARIFMGDVGSTVLGFLAGALMLSGVTTKVLSMPAAVLVFSPFIVDATVTLTRRLLRRENVFRAHRSHYYQRAVQLGLSHRQTVLGQYALMFGCATTAIWMNSQRLSTQWFAIAVWGLIYGLAMAAVAWAERTRSLK